MSRWLSRAALALPALAIATVAVAVNMWVVAHPHRADLTSGGVYSIGPQTQRVLAELRDPVALTFFYDVRSKEMSDARALLKQYEARTPLLTVRAFDPALAPAEARRQQVQFAGTTVFESQGRRVVVNGGSEADFTNGLGRGCGSGMNRWRVRRPVIPTASTLRRPSASVPCWQPFCALASNAAWGPMPDGWRATGLPTPR